MNRKKTVISDDKIIIDLERFQTILDSVSSVIFEVSVKGNILYANQAAVQMFGYTQQELKNMRLIDLVPESYSQGHQEYLSHFFQANLRGVAKVKRFLHYIKMAKNFLLESL
jgi:PAS domain S-box-containing protein